MRHCHGEDWLGTLACLKIAAEVGFQPVVKLLFRKDETFYFLASHTLEAVHTTESNPFTSNRDSD